MPERSAGDMAQIRLIGEQIADAALVKFHAEHPTQPQPTRAEIPPSIKLAGTIVGALLTTGIAAMFFWIVSTLSEMQVTVARIDERQQSQAADQTGKFADIDRRISTLEGYHRSGGR